MSGLDAKKSGREHRGENDHLFDPDTIGRDSARAGLDADRLLVVMVCGPHRVDDTRQGSKMFAIRGSAGLAPLVLSGLLLLAPRLSAQSADLSASAEDVYSLSIGRTWTYRGTVRWTAPESSEVLERNLTWPMEVVDLVERRPVRAALLRGHPSDLVWFEEDREPRTHLLLVVGTERIYRLSGEAAEEAWDRLRDPDDGLIDLVSPHALELELPLYPGKRYCPENSITRGDHFYCWVVVSNTPVRLDSVPGVPAGVRTEYRLALRTIGEHNLVDLVPGVGITAYTFGHHGTMSEVEVELVAVDPPLPTDGRAFVHRRSSGLFSLPADAKSVDWVVVNRSARPQRFRVTVYHASPDGMEVVSPGPVGDRLQPGESFHNANSIAPRGPFRRGFYYEVVVELDSLEVLPTVTVWRDRVNTGIPGTRIGPDGFAPASP